MGNLDLTLKCMTIGESRWTPVMIHHPSRVKQKQQELSVDEMQVYDNIVFEAREEDYAPGVVLHKGSQRVWTPISSRTRSRLKNRELV